MFSLVQQRLVLFPFFWQKQDPKLKRELALSSFFKSIA